MLTKKELDIINIFRKDLSRKETIRSIMRLISKLSYTWTFNAVKKMISKDILLHEKKGKSVICSINLNSLDSIYYLSLLDHLEAADSRHVPCKQIKGLIEEIPAAYFSFIVTGSYAERKNTQKSDLDVCVIVEDGVNKKHVENYLSNKGDLMIPRVHAFVFTKSEFIQMLLDKKENYGKMLYDKRLIYFGAENYYFMIREAIRHGFRS